MIVNCPNCNASYEVNPDIIPTNGRKLRCSSCREVFWCNPHDIENPTQKLDDVVLNTSKESETDTNENYEEQYSEELHNAEVSNTLVEETDNSSSFVSADNDEFIDNVNMQDIFQRLSLQSEEISLHEQNMNPLQKIINKISVTIGWHKKTNRITILVVLGLLVILGLLYFRIEITRKAPFMNVIYSSIGMDAIIPGEGLEFRNVTRREYELDDIPHMEIKGFIDNPTNREIYAELLHVEVLDVDGNIIQQQNDATPVNYFTPKARIPFSIVVVKPSALGKYIVITFAKSED